MDVNPGETADPLTYVIGADLASAKKVDFGEITGIVGGDDAHVMEFITPRQAAYTVSVG